MNRKLMKNGAFLLAILMLVGIPMPAVAATALELPYNEEQLVNGEVTIDNSNNDESEAVGRLLVNVIIKSRTNC